jgi:hypothetical protein
MKRHIPFVSAALLIAALAVPAAAEVHINVNIGPPPPVIVAAPPTMLYLGQPAVYAAVGVPYDIFFVGGRYYYYRGADWFWGPGYGGPWTYVEYRSLPPGLRNYRVAVLRDYRDREYRVYRAAPPRFGGRYFVASHGPGRGRGYARGRR